MAQVPEHESIGQRLRRLRLDRGLSQRELSSPGVSYAYISRIEAGTRQPSVKALRKLAPKLGVSVDYLETGSEIGSEEQLELKLADAELRLRLGDDAVAAEKALESVLAAALEIGDARAIVRARLGLGLAAAELGDQERAISLLESVVDSGAVNSETRPDVYTTLGRAYAAIGRQPRAVELWQGCLDEVLERAPDDVGSRIRYSTYLSYALADLNEFERAQKVLSDAIDGAGDLADPYSQVRVYWGLARLTALQGNEVAAIGHVRKAIALLETTEDTAQLARAHLLAGGILNLQGKAAEALEQLATAEEMLGKRPDTNDLALLRVEQAKAAAELGRADDAVSAAREGLSLLEGLDPTERGSALAALGRGLALEGDLADAKEAFRDGIDLLSGSGKWREAEQACRHWAGALSAAGRKDEAADATKRAEGFASRATAPKATATR